MKPGRSSGVIASVLLFAVTAVVYRHVSCPAISDAQYALLLSENLLRHRSFVLDRHIPRLPPERMGVHYVKNGPDYRIEVARDGLYYFFPPGTSLLSLPWVAAMDLGGKSVLDTEGRYDLEAERRVGADLASILMAALAVVHLSMAAILLPRSWALAVALGAAFATPLWSIASRSMWSHTWLVLLLGIVLRMLLAHEVRGRPLNPLLLGTLLSWMYIVRPTAAISILGVTLYVLASQWRRLPALVATGLLWLSAFVLYSLHHFGTLLPSYYRSSLRLHPHYGWALLGNLVSPSRGLLVFVPVLLVVLLVLLWYRRTLPCRRLVGLSLGVLAAHTLSISGIVPWWGGHCVGPRYFTDVIPWMTLLGAVAARATLDAGAVRSPTSGAALLLLGAGVLMQCRGATSKAVQEWNVPLVSQENPDRIWDWRHPQILAGLIPEYPALDRRLQLSDPAVDPYLFEGISFPEEHGRWTDGPEACVAFRASGTGERELRMMVAPFLHGDLRAQRLRLFLNGHQLGSVTLKRPRAELLRFPVPEALLSERNRLTLELPDAASPRSLRASADERRLGVRIEWLELVVPDVAR